VTKISPYYDQRHVSKAVVQGHHRNAIGGLWDEVGQLQFNCMLKEGLKPGHKLIDIGCGCLRGGVHFIRYLAPGNYFGIDMNQSLLDAGYSIELTDSERTKLPSNQLKCGNDFNFEVFGANFDYAIALSVFTHLPLNHIRVCLERLVDVMLPGSRFLATFFELPANVPSWVDHTHQPGHKTTHALSDPYHYKLGDFQFALAGLPWELRYVGDIGHPRDQRMLMFVRTK
jgi:ubiquinone/menaquinone biosynthesis C-methylase UbiE